MKQKLVQRLIVAIWLAGVSFCSAAAQPNFLVIMVDDLNDYVGCLGGHPNASTPNLDALAGEGVLFTRAFCNAPVCNPSRASIWTGLRPTTTGITSNRHGWFRRQPGFADVITLPQALAAMGYRAMGFGKVFHLGSKNDPSGEWQRYNTYNYGPIRKVKLNYPHGDRLTDWGVPKDGLPPSYDEEIAQRTINALEDRYDGPFFLGCGFFRPHTPLYAAQRWHDAHPVSGIALPPGYRAGDTDDLVYFGKRPRQEQDVEAPGLFNQVYMEETGKWRELLQAYLASTSAMDHELGRVIGALKSSRLYRRNTYVILMSDHGWHLGEKRHWGKAALWEQTTRVPLIVWGPGIPKGVRCDTPVDLLNVYPTVLDFAGVKPSLRLEGRSLRPLLEDATAAWDHPVLTTFVDHHALRTRRWRFIRYVSGEEELYDHQVDPREYENLAVTRKDDAAVVEALKSLRRQLSALLPEDGKLR